MKKKIAIVIFLLLILTACNKESETKYLLHRFQNVTFGVPEFSKAVKDEENLLYVYLEEEGELPYLSINKIHMDYDYNEFLENQDQIWPEIVRGIVLENVDYEKKSNESFDYIFFKYSPENTPNLIFENMATYLKDNNLYIISAVYDKSNEN